MTSGSRAKGMGPKPARVYRTIREWVASGKLQPGEKLPSERTL